MNKSEREKIFCNGGLIRESWDYIDLVLLIFTSGVIAFPWYLDRDNSSTLVFLFLAVAFLIFSVHAFFSTGRLFHLSDCPESERKELEKLFVRSGYELLSSGRYFIDLIRKVSIGSNCHHVVLIWQNDQLWGYSYLDGGCRFNRMPFVTGRSEIESIKKILTNANKTVDSTPVTLRSTGVESR